MTLEGEAITIWHLKAGDDLEFFPPGKIGGVLYTSLAVLLIRTAVN